MKNLQVSTTAWKKVNAIRKQNNYNKNNQVLDCLLKDILTVTCPNCKYEFFIDKKCSKIKCIKCNFEGNVE